MFNEHPLYLEDVKQVADTPIDWEKLRGKTVVVTGATGMIGSFFIDVLMEKDPELSVSVTALGRSEEKAKKRFAAHWDSKFFRFVEADIQKEIPETVGRADYMFHAASNTHPKAYATDPIGTITTNVMATDLLLRYAAAHGTERFLFASSNEIYGENRGDTEAFSEDYLGYIDCNTLRAGYPESKRCGEALCQAYLAAKGLDIVIPRFTRSYGPSLLKTDTKALSQFIGNALNGEDIVLKSEGKQFYSYTYVADAVSGLLTVLDKGKTGEAYNIADERSNITLKDLAALIAGACGRKVVFDLPDAVEAAGFSKATKALLDSTKLKGLGWEAHFDIASGIQRTMEILREQPPLDRM